ncbi:MAG TPA: DUF2158 domain-containing protein [Gemmataceae bacterium]|nr:DUF2158 domain-containing protein [Gemmataceae bacterium]
MDDLKIGDVVELKSGGPAMTVMDDASESYGRGFLECHWFDKEGKPQSKAFHQDALKLASGKS